MNTRIAHIGAWALSSLLLLLGGCQFQPVSASLDAVNTAYSVTTVGSSHHLETHLPVPVGALASGTLAYTGAQYVPREVPPGEAAGSWTRRNGWYYPAQWTSHEEFWFGWLLLDLYSIDRARHSSPLSLEASGTAGLFSAFQADRFTAYYPPSVHDQLEQALSGTVSDSIFGLYFRTWPRDTLVAASVDPGSAAWNAGLRNDDRLLRFDGRWAASSFTYLRDTAGHRAVKFEYLRPSTGLTDSVVVVRTPHIMPTLYADTLPGGVGYIYIDQFVGTDSLGGVQLAEGTDKLFIKASNWLGEVSKGPWILDLRHNGGGLIDASLNIAGSLAPTGASLIQQLARDSVVDETLEPVETRDTLVGDPKMVSALKGRFVYVLQDRHSASASEIVISALRENLGSSIQTIGDTSYGKGIGQIYVETRLGGFMAVTCLHLDPLKAPRYHKIGIAPDLKVDSADISAKAYALALGSVPAARKLSGGIGSGWNAQAFEWNRSETSGRVRSPLKPAAPWRPFPVR